MRPLVRRLALLPLCAGVEPVQNRAWYVLQNAESPGEMYACEAYFEEAIKDSELGSRWRRAGRAGVRDTRRVCGGGGRRVVCEAALGEFVACVMERMRVYARVVPMTREIVAVARMRLQQWRVLNAASSFYLNLNVVNSPSMRVRYGPGAPISVWECRDGA